MITKTALDIINTIGAGTSALAGAYRASGLSEADKDALAAKYDMDSDANFMLRNAGRGMVGGALGTIPGAFVAGIGKGLGSPALTGLGYLGAAAGSLYGIKDWTDKYSKGAAERARRRFKALEE